MEPLTPVTTGRDATIRKASAPRRWPKTAKPRLPGSVVLRTSLPSASRSDEPRAIGVPCVATQFDAIFEIPVGELRPEHYRTGLSVDLVEPGAPPIIPPTARVVRQSVFDDMIPWIMLTLYEDQD